MVKHQLIGFLKSKLISLRIAKYMSKIIILSHLIPQSCTKQKVQKPEFQSLIKRYDITS
ncbi:hypothetical protein SAMN06265367_104139 [Algoriphagus winogradskyi]|uniref:Uncharacterized protein n=1 Tax=Algoriphagus winogradskyi TaxID=237017 RepID=A0ABY1P550_9BACT|nr:hypothetical protein SAMN06265367_104139 [Algoriphagus winogradskyi]